MGHKMKYEKRSEWALTRAIINLFKKTTSVISKFRNRINRMSEGKFSATQMGIFAMIISALLLVIMLFIPPYLGMADDGSFARIANPSGIYHLDDTHDNLYLNYYTKDYMMLSTPSGTPTAYFSSVRLLVSLAKQLDLLFTRGNIFDIRFLALLYGLLYLPAIAFLIKQASLRVKNFTECALIGIFGVVIFTDVSYITYFSSFYIEPLMFVSFLYIVGAAMALSVERHDFLHLFIFTAAGVFLTTSKNQCAVVGALLGIYAVRLIFIKRGVIWRFACSGAALLLFFSMLFSFTYIASDFTQTSKYHAMTSGVLTEASNPEKALAEFGIGSSYSVLTDTKSGDDYPIVNSDDPSLNDGFYNKYDSASIALYYLRHPQSLLGMLDISVKAALDVRRSESGNYEKSVGLPKMAKTPFWSHWSSFKTSSVHKTIGFIFILLIAVILLFRRRRRNIEEKLPERHSIPLEAMILVLLIGLSQALITIVYSGDAEMPEHLFLFSVAIDILIYFCFAEILQRLNAF
jgi:hypothetical protein